MGQAQQKGTSTSTRPIVLILGGGYGGVTLAKLLDATGSCFILLVDQKEFFFHAGAAPRILAQKGYAHRCLIPYDKLLTNGVVLHGIVEKVTPRHVTIQGRAQPIEFDFLVLATGAKYSFPFQVAPRIERAIQESPANGAPSTPAAQPIFTLDTISQLSSVYESIASAKRILVVGGGCVGVEVAAELVAQWGEKALASRAAVAGGGVSPPSVGDMHSGLASQPVSPPQPKEVTLIHSGSVLMNRVTGMREKMRAVALHQLKELGVHVMLQQRAQLESVKEVESIPMHSEYGEEIAVHSPRSKDIPTLLTSSGYLRAKPAHSLVISTTRCNSVGAGEAEPSLQLEGESPSGQFQADLILLCTGVRYDGSLYSTDEELASCLDDKGRLVVNQHLQLEGRVSAERCATSVARALSQGQATTSADSAVHSRFSFHYPSIFAVGDCCVAKSEIAANIAPSAYGAHKQAQLVAKNIECMIGHYPLRTYPGMGPLSMFLSLGPNHGVTQLPNRAQALAGHAMTVLLKSRDMQVEANWAFMNQDVRAPSFKAGVSEGFQEEAKRGQTHAQEHSSKPPQPQQSHPPSLDSSSASPAAVTHSSPSPVSSYAISSLSLHSSFQMQAAAAEAKLAAMVREQEQEQEQRKAEAAEAAASQSEASATPAAELIAAEPVDASSFPSPAGAEVPANAAAPSPTAAAAISPPPQLFRPSGTEFLSVSLLKPLPVSVASSPSASSPIGPILLPGAQEQQFEEAMQAEKDEVETEHELQLSPMPQSEEEVGGSEGRGWNAHATALSPILESAPVADDSEARSPAAQPATRSFLPSNPFLSSPHASESKPFTAVSLNPFDDEEEDSAGTAAAAPKSSNPFGSPLHAQGEKGDLVTDPEKQEF